MPDRHNDLSARGFYGAVAAVLIAIGGFWITQHDANIKQYEDFKNLVVTVDKMESTLNRIDLWIRPAPTQPTIFYGDATNVISVRGH